MLVSKQIRTLQIFKITNIKKILELTKDVMNNISYKVVLRCHVNTTTNYQQECVDISENIMNNCNEVCKKFKRFLFVNLHESNHFFHK